MQHVMPRTQRPAGSVSRHHRASCSATTTTAASPSKRKHLWRHLGRTSIPLLSCGVMRSDGVAAQRYEDPRAQSRSGGRRSHDRQLGAQGQHHHALVVDRHRGQRTEGEAATQQLRARTSCAVHVASCTRDGRHQPPAASRQAAAASSQQAAWRAGEPTLFRTIIGGLLEERAAMEGLVAYS
jgi:hypothetical protein